MNSVDMVLIGCCKSDEDFESINTPRGMQSRKAFDILLREESKQSLGERLKLCSSLIKYGQEIGKEIIDLDAVNDMLFGKGDNLFGCTKLESFEQFDELYSKYMFTKCDLYKKKPLTSMQKNANAKKCCEKVYHKLKETFTMPSAASKAKDEIAEEIKPAKECCEDAYHKLKKAPALPTNNKEKEETADPENQPVKKKRGRPKGSKNKPKVAPADATTSVKKETKKTKAAAKPKKTEESDINIDAITQLAAELAKMDIEKEKEKEQSSKENKVSRKVSMHEDGIQAMEGNNLGSLLKGINLDE